MSIQKEIFTSKCRITLLEPCILENFVLDYSIVELNDLLEVKQINQELTEGKPYVAILVFGEMTEMTSAVRERIASAEHKQNAIAKALLVTNIGHRLLGNFYMAVNKPHIKTKLFTDRETALIWLRKELHNALAE